MSILAVRSVALSTDTANAWKEAGVSFARRGRPTHEIMNMGYDVILNLGKSAFRPDIDFHRVWNHGADIEPLLYPGITREMMNDLMPPQSVEHGDVWIKAPGAHGRGKFRTSMDQEPVLPREWDWCMHIPGQEYRLVTVGHKVVQDFLRHGDNGSRVYEWVPMAEVPRTLKEVAREAARRIPGNNVIAWDMVLSEETGIPYLFEGNTCPGVNVNTVRRIITEIERITNA